MNVSGEVLRERKVVYTFLKKDMIIRKFIASKAI